MSRVITFQSIGHINTEYATRAGLPAQGQIEGGYKGVLVMADTYIEGMKDYRPGDEIMVIFNFHQSEGYELVTIPYKADIPTGVFRTRSPDRPNGLGVTVVKITAINNNQFHFVGADMIDGTPIMDIKPHKVQKSTVQLI